MIESLFNPGTQEQRQADLCELERQADLCELEAPPVLQSEFQARQGNRETFF